MSDSENTASNNPGGDAVPPAPRVRAGQLLREARTRAGLSLAKVSGDLRISAAMLEALEEGHYEKLAGAPYIRALIVSLSRHLHLDPKVVLQAYSNETGIEPSMAVPVSPYKDDSKTHAKAHKQIFILLLAVLLFVLLLIMGKVNSSSSGEGSPPPAPGKSDTLLSISPASDSDSLALDSLGIDSTGADSVARKDSLTATTANGPTATAAATEAQPAAVKEPTTVRIRALSDSVYIRIIRAGRRESSRVLAPGQLIELRHTDAITCITRTSNSVEVAAGGSVVVPDKRRFKVSGSSITY